MGTVRIGTHLCEDFRPVGGAHRGLDLRGWPREGHGAGRSEQQHLVAHIQVRQRRLRRLRCQGHHDDAAEVGLAPQHRHHVVFLRCVQPGARLVNHEQRRSGDQFDRHRRAPAHLGRQFAYPGSALRGELELVENLVHHTAAVVGRGVRRQPQLGGVFQGSFDGEARVRAVVAWHYPDACAHQLRLGVHVVLIHGDGAGA